MKRIEERRACPRTVKRRASSASKFWSFKVRSKQSRKMHVRAHTHQPAADTAAHGGRGRRRHGAVAVAVLLSNSTTNQNQTHRARAHGQEGPAERCLRPASGSTSGRGLRYPSTVDGTRARYRPRSSWPRQSELREYEKNPSHPPTLEILSRNTSHIVSLKQNFLTQFSTTQSIPLALRVPHAHAHHPAPSFPFGD